MSEILIFVLLATSLFIYVALASIEFGSSVFLVFPKLVKTKNSVQTYMNPLWETTSVFLVYTIVSMLAFFSWSDSPMGNRLVCDYLFFLAIYGVRVLCILLVHYAGIKSRLVHIVYMISSFISVILFAFILLYFVTGSWQAYVFYPFSALLVFTMALWIIFFSSAFFRVYEHNSGLTMLVRASGTLFCFTSVLFWINLCNTFPYLTDNPTIIIVTAVLLSIILIVGCISEWFRLYKTALVCGALYMGSLFYSIFLAHIPYIVYPVNTMYQSVTDPLSFRLLTDSFAVGIIIVVPALGLLYSLFLKKR